MTIVCECMCMQPQYSFFFNSLTFSFYFFLKKAWPASIFSVATIFSSPVFLNRQSAAKFFSAGSGLPAGPWKYFSQFTDWLRLRNTIVDTWGQSTPGPFSAIMISFCRCYREFTQCRCQSVALMDFPLVFLPEFFCDLY